MIWKQGLQRVSLYIIFLVFSVATVFGLNTFYYSEKHKSFVDSKFLSRYSKFMGLTFFVFYPLSVLTILVDFSFESIGITDLARNFVYIGTWILCNLIFYNQTSYANASCNLYNQAGALYSEITKNRYETFRNDDTNLSAKCVLKTCFLAVGFLLVNIGKYYFCLESRLSVLKTLMLIYLFVPSFIMVLASNRFYAASTFCLYLIMKINNSIEALVEGYRGINETRKVSALWKRQLSRTTADKINGLAKNYTYLHQLFVDFNEIYAKYIVLVLGFCFVNVVFEVKKLKNHFSKLSILNMKPNFQLYFLYLNVSMSISENISISPFFASLAVSQICLYFIEIFATISIYNQLKIKGEECGTIIHNVPVTMANSRLLVKVCRT